MNHLEKRIEDLENLLESFKHLNSNLNLYEVLDNILSEVIHVVKAEAATIRVVDEAEEEIVASAVKGPVSKSLVNTRLKLNEGIVGKVVSTGVAELIEDVSKHPNWYKN